MAKFFLLFFPSGVPIKGEREGLCSVIENIILNQPVPVGTGLPGLMVKITGPLVKSDDKKAKEKSKKALVKIKEEKKAEKEKAEKEIEE